LVFLWNEKNGRVYGRRTPDLASMNSSSLEFIDHMGKDLRSFIKFPWFFPYSVDVNNKENL
jgi:hypothetical protein